MGKFYSVFYCCSVLTFFSNVFIPMMHVFEHNIFQINLANVGCYGKGISALHNNANSPGNHGKNDPPIRPKDTCQAVVLAIQTFWICITILAFVTILLVFMMSEHKTNLNLPMGSIILLLSQGGIKCGECSLYMLKLLPTLVW